MTATETIARVHAILDARPRFMLAFMLAALVASCERHDALHPPRAINQIGEPLPDSAPLIVDTVAGLPITRQVEIAPSTPPTVATITDTASVATPAELAELSARLDVPVQGVARAQLHDTYAEARSGHVHEALDILAPRGTPVLTAADGRLLKMFNSKAGGLMVYAADPSNHFILLYAHLDGYAAGLSNGMPLRRGQVIGYVGTTGNAPVNTPHLHFGIMRGNPDVSWYRGVPVNPYPLLVPAAHSR